MGLRTLGVRDFRCLERVDLECGARLNVVVGDNASGKTSLLEAIYFLGRGRSFREGRRRALVRRGAEGLGVFGRAEAGGSDVPLGLRWGGQGLEGRVRGARARGIGELAAWLPVQVIDPHVHRLLEGGPGERRRFMDWGVFHVEHRYLETWRRYARALRQRNASLRDSPGTAQAWEPELAAAGAELDAGRREFVAGTAPRVAAIAGRILGAEAEVEVRYRPGWSEDESLGEALRRHREGDRLRGFCGVGPHRAELELRVEGRLAREWLSRGQGKVLAAALVLAEIERALAAGEAGGVLLVDDAAAELGREYLERFWGVLMELPVQKFVTAVGRERLPAGGARTPPARVFHVEHGRVTEVVE